MSATVRNILLVDDEADQRLTTKLLLSSPTVEVIEAASGEEALEKIAQNKPDLVLLDFNMDGIDGIETLCRIRKLHGLRELPVLMLSGREESEIIVKALDSGANDYITKLTSPEVLEARVRRHLVNIEIENPNPEASKNSLGELLLHEPLDDGSVATIYRATDTQTSRTVAVEVLKPGLGIDVERYQRESRYQADYEHVAEILGVYTEPTDYLVFSYQSGQRLDQFIDGKAQEPASLLKIMLGLTRIVDSIHQAGEFHGCLQPTGVILDLEGRPHLTNSGISGLIVQENAVYASDWFSAHPAYLAPEQLRDDIQVDTRADLYALGAILFTLATGRAPFEGPLDQLALHTMEDDAPAPSKLRPDGDRMFDFVCHRLLSKKASQRYQTCQDLIQKLSELTEEVR